MGVALALFVFAVVHSKILPFNFDTTPQANFTYLALAFLAGFSERLSRVVAAKMEERFLGPVTDSEKAPPPATRKPATA